MINQIHITNDTIPNIISMGLFKVDKPWLHFDRVLDVDAFLYVINGCLKVNEGEVHYSIEEGEAFFFKNGVRHWGTELIDSDSKWYWICFKPIESTKAEVYHALPKRLKVSNPKLLDQELSYLLKIYNSEQSYKHNIICSKLYQIYFDLLKQIATDNSKDSISSITEKIINILKVNTNETYNGKKISETLNMDYSSLCRLFKTETGLTINQYHTELRIKKAIELLRNTTMNIGEISDTLEYPNPYFFSRVFKKITGYPPIIYRKQLY